MKSKGGSHKAPIACVVAPQLPSVRLPVTEKSDRVAAGESGSTIDQSVVSLEYARDSIQFALR